MKTKKISSDELLPAEKAASFQGRRQPALPELGDFVWLESSKGSKSFGCVTKIGTNYVQVTGPSSTRFGSWLSRVHIDDLHTLTAEPNAEQIINGFVQENRQKLQQQLREVQQLISSLGINKAELPTMLLSTSTVAEEPTTALAVVSKQVDLRSYQTSLEHARDVELPEMIDAIKKTNEEIAKWMSAPMMPLQAQVGELQKTIDIVDGQVSAVSLYAGLTEEAHEITAGQPAPESEKLHLMQRRLYMDEECLIDYEAGGMDFKKLHEFDDWLKKPENFKRILPFERCLVSFRVRRKNKNYDQFSSGLDSFIKFSFQASDAGTFLYIRNGENLHRLSTDLEFGEMLFPDKTAFNMSEPKVMKIFGNRVDRFMSVSEYENLCQEREERKRKHEEWCAANPDENRVFGPYAPSSLFTPSDWTPFDQTNVYYDEGMQHIKDQIDKYNRVVCILQGIYDRTTILAPHPPIQLWDNDSFQDNLVLVYDGSGLLPPPTLPDFRAYQEACNAQATPDSVFAGAQDAWEVIEAEKECQRRDRDWRHETSDRPKRFQPFGNPGPGRLAIPERIQPRAKRATFSWLRERLISPYNTIRTRVTIPFDKLLNVSAYTIGDYKQFFDDPRTRANYLQWAPMLLAAEDYHRGKRQPNPPLKQMKTTRSLLKR